MSSSSPSEPAWYCLKTQTKREAIAAAHLRELEGVEVFCPMLRYRKATRRGKVWWVEAEALVSALTMYELTKDRQYYDVFERTWAYLLREQIDWEAVRSRTVGHPFAEAYVTLVDGLGIAA